jgi:hypothetical protein
VKGFAILALVVALGAATLAGCSSSSNATADNSSAADNSAVAASSPAAAASAALPIYTGATQTDKTSYGTPPPGATAYVTNDDPVTVAKWYQAQVPSITVAAPATAKGGLLLSGDQKTGTFVTLIGEAGKTYILITPAASMSQ